MDKFRLKLFFYELLKLAWEHPSTMGNPCSWLLEQMCVYQERFLNRIKGDYTGRSHEVRLNNAGLKMHWKMVSSHPAKESDGFKCYIGGDQARDYPFFVAAANTLIKYYGFNRR